MTDPKLFEAADELRQAEDHLRKVAEILQEQNYLVFLSEILSIRIKTGQALLKIAQEVDRNG